MEVLKKFFKERKKEAYFITGALLATVIVVWLLSGAPGTGIDEYVGPTHVPQEFTDARNRAASTAGNLVELTAEATVNIERISVADRNGRYDQGAALAVEEKARNEKIRDIAVDLSEDLRDMANSLPGVRPPQASTVGFQAMTVGIELVQQMIAYSNDTQELLLLVETRLGSGGASGNHSQIEEVIGRINADVAEVNRLNEEYRNLMQQFDILTA